MQAIVISVVVFFIFVVLGAVGRPEHLGKVIAAGLVGGLFCFAAVIDQRRKAKKLMKYFFFYGDEEQLKRIHHVVDEYMLVKIHELNELYDEKIISYDEYSIAINKYIKHGSGLRKYLD